MANKDEVESLLACGEKFHVWARARISRYDKAMEVAAKAGQARILKATADKKAADDAAKAKQQAKAKQVEYVLSRPGWRGVESAEFITMGADKRMVAITLAKEPEEVQVRHGKLFPQVSIMSDGTGVVVTLHTLLGWRVGGINLDGKLAIVEVLNAREDGE
jgi:hypothetical protein